MCDHPSRLKRINLTERIKEKNEILTSITLPAVPGKTAGSWTAC
jgi:hypothetical protein